MAAIRIPLFIITSSLLLLLLNLPVEAMDEAQEDQDGTQIQFREASDAGDSQSRVEMSTAIARNRLIQDIFSQGATLDMWMVVICMELQIEVIACRNIPSFDSFVANLPANAFQKIRRKRHSSWFGSNSGSSNFGGFNFRHPWSGSNYNNFNNHNFNNFNSGFGNNVVICPTAADQSLIFGLNPTAAGYPAGDIGNEILASPLAVCLFTEVIRPNDPPTILVEPFRLTANVTCPFTQLRLWSYQSQTVGSMCWVMQNFQENILYRTCTERFCQDCKSKQRRRYGGSRSVKLCIADYMTVSFWAFCPGLLPGQRIIRDRIIIPSSCDCQNVECDPVPGWGK